MANALVPYVILKFETAERCTEAFSKLTAPMRQRQRWTVEGLDTTRLKVVYEKPRTKHLFDVSIVSAYLGKGACQVLVPDAAEGAAASDTGPVVAANVASDSGGSSAAVLIQRAYMLLEPSPQKFAKSAEYIFHERLGGGIAGRVLRVTDSCGGVFAGKCARDTSNSHLLLREAHILLVAGTHPNLVKLAGVTLSDQDQLCLLFPCASCTFEAYLKDEAGSAQPLARAIAARDTLAALLSAIAHVHVRNIIHTDIKAANLLLERWPHRCFGGRRLLLADFSESVLDDPACRRFQPLADIIKDRTLHTTTGPNRAPELHFGVAAWTKLIDEWSAGTVVLQLIRGQQWPMRADYRGRQWPMLPDMGKVFGTRALQRIFGDAPLFALLEQPCVPPSGAAPGAELDGDGRHVLRALLEPDPAKRGHADDLLQSNWFLERPVFKKTFAGQGGKGPFVIFEAFLGDEVLA